MLKRDPLAELSACRVHSEIFNYNSNFERRTKTSLDSFQILVVLAVRLLLLLIRTNDFRDIIEVRASDKIHYIASNTMTTTDNSFRLIEITGTKEKNSNDSLSIEEPIEDVIVQENGIAIFECKIEGHPQPVCFWYKDGKPITSNQRRKITSNRIWHRLEINKIRPDDHGIYTVVFRNNAKQLSSKAVLFVAPTNFNDTVLYTRTNGKKCALAKQIRNVQAKVGDTIELEAEFQHEVDDYIWFRNNEPIKPNMRIMILNSKKNTTLSILKAEPKDSGVYMIVAKTKQGVVSSLGDVQVIDNKLSIENNDIPYLEELLPDEVETNENEEIRLICKAVFDINTNITWFKNNVIVDKDRFIVEDYGSRYIGLKIAKPSRSDTADYSVVLRDEDSGREETSSCYLTVNPLPTAFIPPVELKKPLDSAVACCGSKLTFDCSFALDDPMYFYVVWYLGRYRVERSNSQFGVICKGGDFVLYIKRLEPGMAGEVTCELRRALPNQRSVFVNSTTTNLAIVPPNVVADIVPQYVVAPTVEGKIYSESHEDGKGVYIEDRVTNGYNHFDKSSSTKSNGNARSANSLLNEVILEISYCRLEEGVCYMQAERTHTDVSISRLIAYAKSKDSLTNGLKTIVIEWDDSILPTTSWYTIELSNNGSYIEVGITSSPQFEINDPPVGKMMGFRIKLAEPVCDCSESSVCIAPTPETVQPRPKDHNLKPMEDFETHYTKTGDLIGCGAFGSVVLVRDETGQHYAAKILKTRTQKKRETAVREFEMMRKLQHPKLVELIDAYVAKDAFLLVMDYLWGGELFDRIVEEEHIQEVDVVPYVRQISEALEYLHSHKIAHLDLKPENIICLSPNSGQVKIIDFGLARILEEGHVTRAIYGTRDYVAPEVLNFERLTLACDMWSLGVVTYMLLSGVMPFAGDTWPERSANITMANYNYDETAFRDISDLAKDFVDKLLVLTAEKRMSAKLALNHKWITEGPPRGAKAGHMKRTRENLKSYLANYRARWQRAGNVMIAAHRLRTHAVGLRGVASLPRVT